MKVAVAFLVVILVVAIYANEEALTTTMTAEEIQELKDGYKDFSNSNGMNAPIREMAIKTKDLTMKYFKTVGIELARHMCNQLDNIIDSFKDNRNDITDV